MRKGYQIAKEINDYTDAQLYFMIKVEEKEHAVSVIPPKTELTISGDDSAENIKTKISSWKKRQKQ